METMGTRESPERQELRALEKTGLYVFHGSDVDVAALAPREAIDDIRGSEGTAAVYASPKADYAIFLALVSPLGTSQVGTNVLPDGTYELSYSATAETLSRLTDDSEGWVYVFPQDGFVAHNDSPSEMKHFKPQTPFKKIRVSRRDLPKNIGIISN